MATRKELAARLAKELAEFLSDGVYGPDGPELKTDIDEFEDLAVLAAHAAFDAVIARALLQQNQKLPSELPCPACQRNCKVEFEERSIQGRLGTAGIREPVCHCSVCDRDFFPSARKLAAG